MPFEWALTASGYAERAVVLCFLVVPVLLACLSLLTPRARELAAVGIVLLAALLLRTLWWDRALPAPFTFSESPTLHVAEVLKEGRLWEEWLASFRDYHVGSPQRSVVMLPVWAAFQMLFGPSIHLPVLVGAFYGVASVLLAWGVGRAVHSSGFGLAFAAFVAISPLQITWSRLGGIYIGSVPYVLLVLWWSYLAGKRAHLGFAIAAGLAAWGTVYNYYAARVAMPLAVAGVLAGWLASKADARKVLRTGAALVAAFVLPVVTMHSLRTLPEMAWPSYGGYVGSKGEQTFSEFIHSSASTVATNAPSALRRYLVSSRAGFEEAGWFHWGAQHGGLCLFPLGVLGVIGMGTAVWAFREHWLWFLVAVMGAAVPILSVPTARRFLILDLAWCALAALGLLAVVDAAVRRIAGRWVARWAVVTFVLVLAGWSFGSVIVLNRVLADGHPVWIPFAESGFGDGLTCLRCLRAGYEWQDEIAENNLVVLFDTDLQRENTTSPGGLPLYGKLGALAAGRPANFIEFYPIMANVDWRPGGPRQFFDPSTADFGSALIERLDGAGPRTVIWHFERPTQWELWLAGRLKAAGAEVTEFKTVLSRTPGLQARTSRSEQERTFAVLRELARDHQGPDGQCPVLTTRETATYPFPLLHVSGVVSPDREQAPEWIVGSWAKVRYGDTILDQQLPIGSSVERDGDGADARLHLLTEFGRHDIFAMPSGTPLAQHPAFGGRLSLDCAVRAGAHWWVVDPTTGELHTTAPDADWLPTGSWVGIARGPASEIVLASADQRLVIVDLDKRTTREFAATVSPSRRVWVGECSPIVAGNDWYGTFNHMTSVLSVYDGSGTRVGTRRLNEAAGLAAGHNWIVAIAAAGQHLAVGYADLVRTFKVDLTSCHHPRVPGRELQSRRSTPGGDPTGGPISANETPRSRPFLNG
jgi:hypothetical protein